MSATILAALSGERVLHTSPLGTVTHNCIVVRDAIGDSLSIISIASVARIETFKTFPLYSLAAASACLLIGAAAQCSKQGGGMGLPIALLGLAVLVFCLSTRKASVAFIIDSDELRTTFGTMQEAARLVAAVRSVQRSVTRGVEPDGHAYSWLRAYLALMV